MKFDLNTEGVLIVCSIRSLYERYNTQSFDYDFPDGILDNVNSGELLAVANVSGDPIRVGIQIDKNPNLGAGWNELAIFNLQVKENDSLIILSHAEFTQNCLQQWG